MGACISSEDKRNKERSDAIDRRIKEDSIRFRKDCKVLLLNSDEPGNTTFVKEMKIVQDGYTPEELAVFRMVVYKNLVDNAKDLVLAMQKIGVDCVEEINRTYAAQIMTYEVDLDDSFRLSSNIVNAIDGVWKDPIITIVMDHSSDFYLMDSASYFFSQVHRIGLPDYIPNESDIIRARSKTTRISETRFNMGQLSIHILDVSGLQSSRKNWIHCFEAVTSIIFCVALSEYDEVFVKEEKEHNRMAERLVLFENVVNRRWFLRTSVILLFTKVDVFKAKLAKVPLEKYFPDYTGGPDVNKAVKYILSRFTEANGARLSVFSHIIQANDPSIVRAIARIPTVINELGRFDSSSPP